MQQKQIKLKKHKSMGQIPLEETFRGFGVLRSVLSRLIHSVARSVPMFPQWRVTLHRLRGVKIGEGVFIGSEVFIDNTFPESIVIEDCVTIISRTFIIGHTFTPAHLRNILPSQGTMNPGVHLKKGCYIGGQSIIMPGATVGECAIVGSGSVVTGDIPPYSVAMGSPARVVRTFDEKDVIWEE